ncbi:DUF2267 domain-containing protein [Pleurocapsales cyanobacterium LEGE 06147]|nr:DUF2267 domain-containing protein [Pleurocapsales cyanobacterium LEGE 06147]
MEYQQFTQEVENLDFISERDTADAAVKAVLGILASRMEESDAQKLTEQLPEPLTLEKLRSHQQRIINISVDQFFEEISTQFKLSVEQARTLANRVFHLTKDAVGNETVNEIQSHLPSDWASVLQGA